MHQVWSKRLALKRVQTAQSCLYLKLWFTGTFGHAAARWIWQPGLRQHQDPSSLELAIRASYKNCQR
jgi:hypothetical protein